MKPYERPQKTVMNARPAQCLNCFWTACKLRPCHMPATRSEHREKPPVRRPGCLYGLKTGSLQGLQTTDKQYIKTMYTTFTAQRLRLYGVKAEKRYTGYLFLISVTAKPPNTKQTPATTIMWLCTLPTRVSSTPPTRAATICGTQMVPLNRPRYAPMWP